MSQRSVGDYEILDEVSRGAMGVVYKARHKTLGRIVALKVMIAGEHASPDQIVRFEKEARAAAKLRHPNVVPIYDVGIEDGRRFFTMDFIDGTPLDVLIARKELTPRRALDIAAEVADALEYAHTQGVIHRDIKPSNIMIDDSGRPQVMDFGLAKQLDSDTKFTRTGTTIGTPSYMSPEQARGENTKVTQLSDVYSLGAVMYEMLTCKAPFTGETMMNIVMKVIHDDPVPLRRTNAKLHRDIQTIVLKAMEKEPARRYASMGDLGADIRRYTSGEMITARPAGPFRRVGKALRKHRTTIVVGLVIAALVSGVAGTIIGVLIQQQREVERQRKAARLRAAAVGRELELSLADHKPEWVVQFKDDFSGPKLGTAWKPSGKEWKTEKGYLAVKARRGTHIVLDPPDPGLEGKAVIEFTAVALTPDARINCFLGGERNTAHTFRFGSWGGNCIALLRGGRLLARVECPPIIPNITYRFRIERRKTLFLYRVTYRVENEEKAHELRYEHPRLLRSLGRVRFGFDTWASTVHFDDVKLSGEVFGGERLNKLQAIDFYILSRGQLEKALSEYDAIIERHSGKAIAALAEHHCGLVREALAGDRQRELKVALQHYRNFEQAKGLLEERHRPFAVTNRQRIFFVLAKLARFQPAADELVALCGAGEVFDAGSVWDFPDILSRCAGARAYGPALRIMEKVRFSGARPTLRKQWAAFGTRVRSGFVKALNEVCGGFADQQKYEQMKRAFLALPDPGGARSFELATKKAVDGNNTPVALDLLAFAAEHKMQTRQLERSAVVLAGRFIAAKQYGRIVNVHKAYRARGLAMHFNTAVSALARAGDIKGAMDLFATASYYFDKDKRRFYGSTELLMSACTKADRFAELRWAYGLLDDTRFAKHLFAAADKQIKASQLTGAREMLDYVREKVPGRIPEVGRLAGRLATKLVAEGEPAGLLELYEKYPGRNMAAPFAAAIERVARTEHYALLERLLVKANAAFPKDQRIADTTRGAAMTLIEAGETALVVKVYEDAAKAQGDDKRAAAVVLGRFAETLRAGRAYAEAAVAYAAAAHAVPKDTGVAAPALAKAGALYELLGETERARKTWTEIVERHPKAVVEANVAKLMTGAMSPGDFTKWLPRAPKAFRPGESDFFLGLRAASDSDNDRARKALNKALSDHKGAWFHQIAEALLKVLPEPEPPPQPPED